MSPFELAILSLIYSHLNSEDKSPSFFIKPLCINFEKYAVASDICMAAFMTKANSEKNSLRDGNAMFTQRAFLISSFFQRRIAHLYVQVFLLPDVLV